MSLKKIKQQDNPFSTYSDWMVDTFADLDDIKIQGASFGDIVYLIYPDSTGKQVYILDSNQTWVPQG